ncbi:MAG: hypothetical protein ACO1TE_29390 [Prosthecobacter sp.]
MFIGRLLLAVASCLLLTQCGLINQALRLAPYLLMFAEEEQGQGKSGQIQQRARHIEQKGSFSPQQRWMPGAADSKMASASAAR